MIFLGILLDVENFILAIPIKKHNKALFQICLAIAKRKLMVKQIQQLIGILSFLNRALIPGRAFTRRMYAKLTGLKTVAQSKRQLKHYHHVNLDSEFLQDCKMWENFLTNSEEKILCHPFLDVLGDKSAEVLRFYSDASGSSSKGFGCFYESRWTFGLWEKSFIEEKCPSIKYLELYALCVGIFAWASLLKNQRIVIYCNNQAVVDIVKATSSKCKNCMVLVRMLVMNNLLYNRKIYVHYIATGKNLLADALSRQKFAIFWKYAPKNTRKQPDKIPAQFLPMSGLWID